MDNVLNDKYLTDARVIIDNTNETIDTTKQDISNETIDTNKTDATVGDTSSEGTNEYFDTIVGKRSGLTYGELLELYRRTFLNIDMMIIGELEELFIHLW